MSKHLTPETFIEFPSGSKFHPSRLIHRDGTIMWKHALRQQDGCIIAPATKAIESHIIKTAQRLEELNCWVSQNLEPWDCLQPCYWYDPASTNESFANGYACMFNHASKDLKQVYESISVHVSEFETIALKNNAIFFQRC